MRPPFYFILFCLTLGLISALAVKIVIHEKWQSNKIHEQTDMLNDINEAIKQKDVEIALLREQIDKLNGKIQYDDNAFNYLAIGNSITVHDLSDYWWNKSGMAATITENDYVHIVADYLKREKGVVCFYAVNYWMWEKQVNDRAETYGVIDPYLDKHLDLVTIQLGENASDLSTFEVDFGLMIRHIMEKAPKAQILILDDFWDNDEKEFMKKEVANRTGVKFVSLDEIKDNPEYQCGIGTVVYDEEGNEHIVEHAGVAKHPGDKGMLFIAKKVIEALKE